MDNSKSGKTTAFEWNHYEIYTCFVGRMATINILEAIDDEDLGAVRRWLNTNTGRENINKLLNSNKTILNRALEVAANYSARNTFAHRIVNTLREYGAHTKQELETILPAPIITPNIFEGNNFETNIFRTPVANTELSTDKGKPPLAPRRNQTQPSRKLNGIAFGSRRNKRNSRKRRATRRN